MFRLIQWFLMLLMVAQFVGLGHGIAQANGGALSTKVLEPLRIEQYGVYNAVAEISQKAHVPIGVDAILPAKEPTIVIDYRGGTLANLLNAVVALAPEYSWDETTGGVIHVVRKIAHVSLLDMTMYYPGAERKTRQEIWEDLANRQEIAQWLRSNNCQRQEIFMGNEFRRNNGPISIAPGTMTLRQLFDEVTVKSGTDGWFVLQSPPSDAQCHVSLMLW